MRLKLPIAVKRWLVARTLLEAQLYPALELPAKFRPFAVSDYEACVSIYRQNEAGRFPPGHGKQFEACLQQGAEHLIVAELDSQVIGYGGIHLASPQVAVLSYGILAPEHQRKRIGSTLILLRLAQLPARESAYYVIILAVEASMGIYGRFGFGPAGLWADEDGKPHPSGMLRVAQQTLATIKAELDRRGIRLEGTLSLDTPPSSGCTIERTALGMRFHFGKSKGSAIPPSPAS